MDSLTRFLEFRRFIVLGGHKCGTSSLHTYLKQHPEILMPKIKGQDILNFPTLNIEDYYNSYEQINQETIYGEVSSIYLNAERAYSAIKQYFPEAKLLIILRNPVDRAFSHFNMIAEEQQANLNFKDACRHKEKYDDVFGYGFYYDKIKHYLDGFDPDKIKILLFDDFTNNKKQFYRDIFTFVEVDPDFVPDTSIIMRKGGKTTNKNLKTDVIMSNKFWQVALRPIVRTFTTEEQRYRLGKQFNNLLIKKESLASDLRASLIDFYREDVLRTEELIGIELSQWLKTS